MNGALPPPLHIPHTSADLAALVGEAIEEAEVEGGEARPFSPTAVAQQLSELGKEFLADHGDLRDELLSPEARAQLPRPPT